MPPAEVTLNLFQWLGKLAPELHLVDVGAMWFGAEAVTYKRLIRKGLTRVVGFEPGPGECERLNALKLDGHVFLPYFIGDGTERTFQVNRAPMTSSLYESNEELVRHFHQLDEVHQTVQRIPAKTTRLDDVPEISRIDYLKLDVQGAELDVLRGGERHLKNALFVQAELEFVPLYKGQALFSDVEPFLRERGFLLHTITPSGRVFKPFGAQDPDLIVRQTLWAECFFVRDFTRFGELSADELLRLAVILHEHMRSVDLAALALQHYDAKTGKDPRNGLWDAYVRRTVPAVILPGGKVPAPFPMEASKS